MASTFSRVQRILERNQDRTGAGVGRLFSQRGPGPGEGRGAGQPWAGIVEETPALWVIWFVVQAKRLGWQLPLNVTAGGRPLRMTPVAMTFGPRWYWLCPDCGRRCEAVYLRGGRLACRKCHRLGYRSQTQRITSVHAWLDLIFDREALTTTARYRVDKIPEGLVNELQQELGAQIAKLFESVRVEHGNETTERTDSGAGTDAGTMGGPGRAGSGPE